MAFGISIYPGLSYAYPEILGLLRLAARHNITRVFTSLHIPESDGDICGELRSLIVEIHKLGMEITADALPESLNGSLEIDVIRADDGFATSDIAALTATRGQRVELNASTVSESFIAELRRERADFSLLSATHNFYPREGTGLSVRAFKAKTEMLQGAGIKCGAFIASKDGGRRAPLFDGLPTLEMHRDFPVGLAARHLAALGIDDVIIADAMPTEDELAELSSVVPGEIAISAKCLTKNENLRALLIEKFTARPDESAHAIRAVESRERVKKTGCVIPPENTADRPFGAVAIDNENYPRYHGELQIIKRPKPSDPRVNVVLQIDESELFLIPCIKPGMRFSFLIHD